MRICFAIIIPMMVLPAVVLSQQKDTDLDKGIQLPDKFFGRIQQTSKALQYKLDRQTARYLQRIISQEQKIKRRLAKKDSSAAKQLFGNADALYQQLQQPVNLPGGHTPYIPYLDTLTTSLKFLEQNPQLLQPVKQGAGQLKESMGSLRALEGRLQQAEAIQKILRQRQQYLQERLQSLGFVKAYQKLHKEVYYYGQQINEYKGLLKHPGKIERKAIDLLSKTKAFQDFMHRNSRLASLFRLPGNDNNTFTGSA